MEDGADGPWVAGSLAEWIGRLTFVDLETDAVTSRLVDEVVAWAASQGWRAYRRAPSVLPLPAPYQNRRSCVDVGCARPNGAPVVVEVDRSDRQRTVEKLLAEAAAGRIAIWLRWGSGGFACPPDPVHLVTCLVTTRRASGGRPASHSRRTVADRPAPEHTMPGAGDAQQNELFT